MACGIIAAIDTSATCVCEFTSSLDNSIFLQNVNQDLIVCSRDTTELPIIPFAGYTYQWSGIDAAPEAALSDLMIANPDFTFQNDNPADLTFLYKLVTNRNGCISADTIEITVKPFTQSDTTQVICAMTTSSLHGPVGFTNYLWTPAANLMDANDPLTGVGTLDSTITYVLSYTDLNGCLAIHTEILQEDTTCVDLELEKTSSPSELANGDTLIYSLFVTNKGPGFATGVEVYDTLPPGVNFVFANSTNGFYNSISHFWRLTDTVFAGTTERMDIKVTVDTIGIITNEAQIGRANQVDIDSYPGNDDREEDDIDYECTVVPIAWCLGDTFNLEVPMILNNVQWYKNGGILLDQDSTWIEIVEVGSYLLHGTDPLGRDTFMCPVDVYHGNCPFDWGDLPDLTAITGSDDYQTDSLNNGPGHLIVPGLHLGDIVDAEPDGIPTTTAVGDDSFGDDDEDGLGINSSLDVSPGGKLKIPLAVTNTTAQTAYVEAWIDWNGDGDFSDPGEMIFDSDDSLGPFNEQIPITVPQDASMNQNLGIRIRISHEDNMTPYGSIASGEVEDYIIRLECNSQDCIKTSVQIKRK